MRTVRMIVYDAQKPEKIILVEAPTPGHFNPLESAFIEAYPEYREKRFTLVVREIEMHPMRNAEVGRPTRLDGLVCLGKISGDEFINLFAGTKAPDMAKKVGRR